MRTNRAWILWCCAIALGGCGQSDPALTEATPESAEEWRDKAGELSEKFGAPVRVVPKAIVDETEFHFGTMDPLTSSAHEFVITNDGSAPLKLQVLDTSCKCTVGSLADGEVPPGKSTTVRMEWNTGNKVSHYRQWSRITTNDPEHETITFRVQGTVRQDIRFEPEELVFGDIMPTESVERELFIYSDRLQDFSLDVIKLTHGQLASAVKTATPEQLSAAKAMHGYVVTVTTPTTLPTGTFNEMAQITLRKNPDEEPVVYEIPVQGKVLGRLSVLGQQIDKHGCIDFGVKPYGRGGIAKMKVKVRDENTELNITGVTIEPDFLKATLTPAKSAAKGLYDLVVELPEDAPPSNHRGDAMGKIRFAFDHPRIDDLNLRVDFSISPVEQPR